MRFPLGSLIWLEATLAGVGSSWMKSEIRINNPRAVIIVGENTSFSHGKLISFRTRPTLTMKFCSSYDCSKLETYNSYFTSLCLCFSKLNPAESECLRKISSSKFLVENYKIPSLPASYHNSDMTQSSIRPLPIFYHKRNLQKYNFLLTRKTQIADI